MAISSAVEAASLDAAMGKSACSCHDDAYSSVGHAQGPLFELSSSSNEAALEVKIANFINDFLSCRSVAADHVVSPRRRLSKNKRYRGMWRLAAKSLMTKQGLLELSNRLSDSKVMPSPGIFSEARDGASDNRDIENCQNDGTDGIILPTSSSHGNESTSLQIPLHQPTAVPKVGIDQVSSDNTQGVLVLDLAVRNLTCNFTKPTCKKPPRPPRVSSSHPTTSRLGFSKSFKRITRESTKVKRSKVKPSASSLPSFCTMFITLCFATIILVQGLIGRSHLKETDVKINTQGADQELIMAHDIESNVSLRQQGAPFKVAVAERALIFSVFQNQTENFISISGAPMMEIRARKLGWQR